MTTATLTPTQAQSPFGTTPEAPTQSAWPAWHKLIREAARLCASRYHQQHELEDMVQEANLAVWQVTNTYPDPSNGLIWTAAYRAAYNFIRKGKSIHCPLSGGKTHYFMTSLEAIMESKDGDGWDIIEGNMRRRHGELPNPTEDVAVAHVMLGELERCLSPRQGQVLTLRLAGCTEQEISALLHMCQSRVSGHIRRIRAKAKAVWGDKPPEVKKPARVPKHSPEERREIRRAGNKRRHLRYLLRHRETINARKRAWRAEHREEYTASQRAWRRMRREQKRGGRKREEAGRCQH